MGTEDPAGQGTGWTDYKPKDSEGGEDQMVRLATLHDKFGRALERELTLKMRGALVQIEAQPVQNPTFEQYRRNSIPLEALGADNWHVAFLSLATREADAAATQGSFIMAYDRRLLFAYIDRVLGGTCGAEELVPPERALTPVERTLAKGLEKVVAVCLAEIWKNAAEPLVVAPSAEQVEFESRPFHLNQIADAEDQIVELSYAVSVATHTAAGSDGRPLEGRLSFGYPAKLVAVLLGEQQVERRVHDEQEETDETRAFRRSAAAVLERRPCRVEVRAGECAAPLRSVLQMREGDLVVLDQRLDRPFTVYVGGRPRFLGWGGRRERTQRYAVRIERELTADEAELAMLPEIGMAGDGQS